MRAGMQIPRNRGSTRNFQRNGHTYPCWSTPCTRERTASTQCGQNPPYEDTARKYRKGTYHFPEPQGNHQSHLLPRNPQIHQSKLHRRHQDLPEGCPREHGRIGKYLHTINMIHANNNQQSSQEREKWSAKSMEQNDELKRGQKTLFEPRRGRKRTPEPSKHYKDRHLRSEQSLAPQFL